MPEVLLATPLNYAAASRPYALSDGISIRELSPIRWDVARIKSEVSEREREELAKTKYWLCAAKEYEYAHESDDDELLGMARDAAMALQIICPIGAKHVFLKFESTPSGWDNVSNSAPNEELCKTLLGKITHLEDRGFPDHFGTVYEGIRRANNEQLVRLQNPVHLLAHGMQTGHHYLGTLMFVMGLDVLFMAGESSRFMERVGGFLGLDSLIFPPDSFLHRQPNTTVRDVLENLYALRNTIAHGQEIPKHPYREKHDLMSTDGHKINYSKYFYAELMLEASVFMLTTALRRIYTEGLYDDVADVAKWRGKLTIYEHRYKDAGGPRPAKKLGR